MNKHFKIVISIFFSFVFSNDVFSEVNYYPIKPASNKSVIGTGLGLESGLVGMRASHWFEEPAIIVNFALGLEGFSPVVRIPLVNITNYDFYLDTVSLFTPGLLGIISGDDAGLLFSRDTFLLGAGFGIQRWVRKRTEYGFYFSAGIDYWFQITGHHEGGEIGLSPEIQIGVIF